MFEHSSTEKAHQLLPHANPFWSESFERMLSNAFPYLQSAYYRYQNNFLVRMGSVHGRYTSMPFSGVGDVIALDDQPLNLEHIEKDFLLQFGERASLRVHEGMCPTSSTVGASADVVDFKIDLRTFEGMQEKFRKDIQTILSKHAHHAEERVQACETPEHISQAYQLYLKHMQRVMNVAIPFTMFEALCQSSWCDTWAWVEKGKVRSFSMFAVGAHDSYYIFSASDKGGREAHAAHVLLYHAMETYARKGKQCLWLGPTRVTSPLLEFKRGWRGEMVPIHAVPQHSGVQSGATTLLRPLWRLLPLSAIPAASNMIGRYVL